jgi:hypothetical protein
LLPYVVAAPVVVLLLALLFGVILPRRKRRALLSSPIPIAPFGRGDMTSIPPRPSRLSPPSVAEQSPPVAAVPQGVATMPPSPSAPAMPVELRALEIDQFANEDRARVLRMHVAGDRRDVVRDERSAVTLRLERPHDGTLQFLPGRLEILDGAEAGQEVKFVRTPGPDGTTITFGRAEGAQYRHVQLHEPTVSRMHAKLALDGKSWSLVNLSATNPVVVNGLPLSGEGSTVVLREGDRIEMGEVVFRFRAK